MRVTPPLHYNVNDEAARDEFCAWCVMRNGCDERSECDERNQCDEKNQFDERNHCDSFATITTPAGQKRALAPLLLLESSYVV